MTASSASCGTVSTLLMTRTARDAALFDLFDQALLGGANLRARLDHEHRDIDLCDRVGHNLDHELTQRGARLVQTGRVQKDKLAVILAEYAGNARACGLRLVGNNGNLIANQFIG